MPDPNIISRIYRCKICNENHTVDLPKSLLEGRETFPFAHVYLHGTLQDILTILYLDKDLQIRGADIQQLDIDNLFSKDQSFIIADSLTDEIQRLQEEIDRLNKENVMLKKQVNK